MTDAPDDNAIFPGAVSPRGFGTLPLEHMATRSGLEMLNAMLAGEYPAPPISRTLAFALVEASPGVVMFEGMPSAAFLNPLGAVHGGWAAAIVDSALGCAVHTTLQAGEGYTTAEMKVNYLRPITPATGKVRCEGKVVHRGRTLALSEARLTDSAGKLLAFATETCSIFPLANMMR